MSTSISSGVVRQLVIKDLQIMKLYTLCWWLASVLSVLLVALGGTAFFMVGFILFITGMAGAGVHCVMQTVSEERTNQSRAFVMSLPISVREYTSAKLIINLLLFGVVWLTLSPASFLLFIGDDAMPAGTAPFVAIVLVGIFLAFTALLAITLVRESMAVTIAAIVGVNILTQIYLWLVADLYGIRAYLGGDVAQWNSTVFTVLGIQLAAIVALIVGTFVMQSHKRDFIA